MTYTNIQMIEKLNEIKYGFDCVNSGKEYGFALKESMYESSTSENNMELPYILNDFLDFAGNEQGGLVRENVFDTIYKTISFGIEKLSEENVSNTEKEFLNIFDKYVLFLDRVVGEVLNDARLNHKIVYAELEREPSGREQTLSRNLYDASCNVMNERRRKEIIDGKMGIDWRLLSSKL
ncbi:hypothetical protein GQ473_05145 [archaeon]|nr:hypothetical protein [archaeon]